MSDYMQKKIISSKRILLYIVAFVASLGGLLAGFDMGVISGALPFIKRTWELSALTQGWVVSAAIVGSVVGAAANGVLADIFGRRKIIISTAVIFIIGSIWCGVALDISQLIAARILVGIAVGMVTFVVPLYLSEISPQKIRGTLVSMFQLSLTAGILLSYLINGIFAHSEHTWRWMLGSGTLPAILLYIGILFLHDTPRWLLTQGREEEARNVFKVIIPDEDVDIQIAEIKQTLQHERKGNNSKFVFQKWMFSPILLGIGLMFMQICTGINTIIYYTATIFNISGFETAAGAIYATIGIGVVNFFMTLVAIALVDRLGRKPLLYIGLSGMFIGLITLSASFSYADILGDNLKWFAVSSVTIYIAAFACSLGPVVWIMVSEILPLQIRGLAMSICTVSNFGFNFIVVLSFLPLLDAVGETYAFVLFALITLICIFFVYFFVPETKGISLEKIESNWHNKIPARRF